MARAKAPQIDWRGMTLAQLERHLADLEAVGKAPTAAFMTALRERRRQAELGGPSRPCCVGAEVEWEA